MSTWAKREKKGKAIRCSSWWKRWLIQGYLWMYTDFFFCLKVHSKSQSTVSTPFNILVRKTFTTFKNKYSGFFFSANWSIGLKESSYCFHINEWGNVNSCCSQISASLIYYAMSLDSPFCWEVKLWWCLLMWPRATPPDSVFWDRMAVVAEISHHCTQVRCLWWSGPCHYIRGKIGATL